jgi:hypothetical protein
MRRALTILVFALAMSLGMASPPTRRGYTDTSADVTSGFAFTINKNLTSARASGSNLPATTCTFDANFNLIGCTDTTIDVSADWTGQGPLGHGTSNTSTGLTESTTVDWP